MIPGDISPSLNAELVFVDLDRCLLREDSIRFLATELVRRKVFGRSLLLKGSAAYLRYRLNLGDPEPLVRYGVRYLKGKEYGAIEELSEYVYRRYLRGQYRLALVRELEEHLKVGRQVFLLTGGLPPIPSFIQKELGLSGVYSTLPELEGGRFTGNIYEPPCVGKGKVVHAHRACQEQGAVLSHAWFYTDSFSDLPLLRIVAHPVVVEPDLPLLGTALRQGWKVLRERKEKGGAP